MLAVILALLLGSIIFIPFGFILDFSLDGNKNRIAVLFWVINPTISAGLEIKGQPVLHSLKGDWWKKIIPGKKKTSIILDLALNILLGARWKKISLNIDIGMDEASLTAIATGILWGSLGNVLAFLKNRSRQVKNSLLNINPHYNKNLLRVSLQCILAFNLGNILLDLLTLSLKRRRFTHGRTSH